MKVKFTPIRVVCHNTLTQALNTGFTYTARHDRDLFAGLNDVQEAMGLITRQYDDLAHAFGVLARVTLTDAAFERYLAKVFPVPADADDEPAWERMDGWRYWSAYLFEHGRGNDQKGVAGSLWAAYNAVTELVDHSGGRLIGPRAAENGRRFLPPAAVTSVLGSTSAGRRPESRGFGAGYRTKVRAWDTALEIARSEGHAVAS